MRRSFVLGLGLLAVGFVAGCGGSPPADSAESTSGTSAAATAPAGVTPSGASSITGTITYSGQVPTLPPLSMDAEPLCAALHEGPVPAEMLVLGDGSTMGNVLVWVSGGLPEGTTWAVPTTPVVLDQKGCLYSPHVMSIMAGQPYRILNSDGFLHNIHTLPKANRTFNQAMPPTLTEVTTTFDQAEPIFQIKCDVHPWMLAYMGVFTHPFHTVTGTDGTFTIPRLEAGTYEITAWHERLGMQTASVTVGASGATTQDFSFSPPAR